MQDRKHPYDDNNLYFFNHTDIQKVIDIFKLTFKEEKSIEKYKCIKTFELPKYDEDESPTEEYAEVQKGSVWEYDSGYIGESDIRMYAESGDDDFGYIDITTQHFDEYFTRIG